MLVYIAGLPGAPGAPPAHTHSSSCHGSTTAASTLAKWREEECYLTKKNPPKPPVRAWKAPYRALESILAGLEEGFWTVGGALNDAY